MHLLAAPLQESTCVACRLTRHSLHRRYEKLQRWDDALRAYQRKLESTAPGSAAHVDALLGECRCLAALAEWDKLFGLCKREWIRVEPYVRREMAPIAAHASWQLGEWHTMRQYVEAVNHGMHASSAEGAVLSAVINIKNGDYTAAGGERESGVNGRAVTQGRAPFYLWLLPALPPSADWF